MADSEQPKWAFEILFFWSILIESALHNKFVTHIFLRKSIHQLWAGQEESWKSNAPFV
jgi:hypothetical protein